MFPLTIYQPMETIAFAKLVVKVKDLRNFFFLFAVINCMCIWIDNTAAIAVATGNYFTHETVEHVTVKFTHCRNVYGAESL